MPPHAVLGVVAITLASIAGVLGIIYATVRSSRQALRWPLAVAVILAAAGASASGKSGKSLLESVKHSGTAVEAAAANVHAHGSDALTFAVYALAIAVLATIWTVLRPSRNRGSTRMSIGTRIVGVASAAAILTAGIVLVQAINAVAAGHPSWGTP